ncbi:MAG: hypothetical protein HRF43_00970 [Phycisphaerae bacterium]
MPAEAVLDRYFLDMRAKVLDVAATLDRIDRADGSRTVRRDGRLGQLREAIGVLLSDEGDRAARVQMIFSDPYEPNWPRPPRRS